MPQPIRNPLITPAGEGKVWNVAGEQIACKLSSGQTGDAYAVNEALSPPQGGPPLHLHRVTDEIFYVIEGDYEVVCGDSRFNAQPGTLFVVPKGVPHRVRNVSTTNGRVLVTLVPGGFQKFFEDADGVANPDKLAEIAQRHDIELLPPNA
jgi:mannose-6-phosphate isomerase-like protein (cupin superfamily)